MLDRLWAIRARGTVEFIADASEGLRADRIWFMEMNTRLQVEHPVTEAITGLDLVEWQLRVASGESLPLSQGQITITGHAMEARLYAEDPTNGFLPSTGRLLHMALPSDVRVDSGFEQTDVVSPFYDPMIAKLVVHAADRSAAAIKLANACAAVEVWPVKTNAAFLARCVGHPDFIAAKLDHRLHCSTHRRADRTSIAVRIASGRGRFGATWIVRCRPLAAWATSWGLQDERPASAVDACVCGRRRRRPRSSHSHTLSPWCGAPTTT